MLDLSHLNPEQKEAVIHENGPLLIVAGAGTGKTTVITNRVAWLIDQGKAKADEILCLTFTDKAAGEMEERIDKLLPYGYVDLWVMTFHAFAERLLKQHSFEIGLASDFTLLDQTAQWMLVHEHFDRFALEYYKPLGKPTKFISAMLTHFSRAKDEGITPETYLDYVDELVLDTDSAEFLRFGESIKKSDDVDEKELWTQEIARRKEMANAYFTYQKLLQEQNALDFGDLLLYVKKLFSERPHILAQYQQQFKYILVDEFQDTNWAQYDIVQLLAGKQANITVVGDDDQSIYKFRGASLSNILGFKSDYADSKQVVLTQNYRSSQNILDLAYNFIQHNNPHRLEYQLNQDEETAKAAKDKSLDLSAFAAINKELKAATEDKGVIEHLHFHSLTEEAAGVVNKIIELRQNDPKLTWADFAILVRANGSAEPFLQQLTLAEIPYQFLASQGLFSQPAILDILSYLRLLDDYAESTALYRILILPTVNIGNEDLMLLLHTAKKEAISLREAMKKAETLEISEEGKTLCRDLLAKIEKHTTDAREKRVSELAMIFLDDFGLKQYYEQIDPIKQRDLYAVLNQFWRFMQQFEQTTTDKTIKPFLEYLRLAEEAGDTGSLPQDLEAGPETVKIMTIHGSKGLEFEHVFVVNLVDRRFPTTERKDPIPLPEELIQEMNPGENHHLEEERRLCYVALTRARRGLYVTSAEDYGGARKKKLSRFLLEMQFEKKEAIQLASASVFGESLVMSFEVNRAKEMNYLDYLPKTFSYSQLKVFQTCPWQYRYAFIMKIPVQGRFTFSFGKTLHHALEKFFQLRQEGGAKEQAALFTDGDTKQWEPDLSTLLDLYEESWIDDWYANPKQKAEYKEKGKSILTEFYNLHKDHWPETVATEQGFTLKIDKYTLRGSIDRVDQGGSGLRLIDYKTGSVPKTDRSIDKDQLTLYQIAAEEVLEKEVEDLTYYYLNEQVTKSFQATEKQKEKLKEKVVKVLNELTSSSFESKPSKQVCSNCDYKDICQYRIL